MKIIWFLALILTIPTSGLSLLIALILTFFIVTPSHKPIQNESKDSNVIKSKEISKSPSNQSSKNEDVFLTPHDLTKDKKTYSEEIIHNQKKVNHESIEIPANNPIIIESQPFTAIKVNLSKYNTSRFLSTSSIARIFGFEAKPVLFDLLEKNNYIKKVNNQYILVILPKNNTNHK